MKSKVSNPIIFISSVISLIISLRLFWNLGIFVDEYGSSPGIVLGGDFWLYMNWLTFPLLLVMCFISLSNLLRTKLIISTICLVTFVKLFWNLGIFVDEYVTSPNIVLGGDFWLYMNWLRLALVIIMFLLSAISILPVKKDISYIS